MGRIFLESNYRVTISLNGNNMGVFDKKSGGSLSAPVSSYAAGGMAPPEVVSAPPNSIEVITLTKAYRTDDHDVLDTWNAAVGKGSCTVREQPLDQNGAAYGAPIVWTGLLTSVATPDHDSTSASESMMTITITPGGTVAS